MLAKKKEGENIGDPPIFNFCDPQEKYLLEPLRNSRVGDPNWVPEGFNYTRRIRHRALGARKWRANFNYHESLLGSLGTHWREGGVPRINVVVFTGNLLRDTVVRRSCIFMPQGAKVAPKMFQIGHFGPQKQYGEPGVLQILAPHPKIPWPFSSMRKL